MQPCSINCTKNKQNAEVDLTTPLNFKRQCISSKREEMNYDLGHFLKKSSMSKLCTLPIKRLRRMW